MKILIMTTSLADQKQADNLARLLLEKRLIACAQVQEIKSHYHWQDKINCETEYRLTLKTRLGARQVLIDTIIKHHSYDLPQITCWQAEASDEYGQWVANETCQDTNR